MSDILISTMNDLPGYDVVTVHGEVYGIIVRARNVFSNIGAGLRTVVGGEAKGYTKLLADSRDQATERLRTAAAAKGANAVLAMRFDCNEIGDVMSEVAAYGTAVTVRPAPVSGPGPLAQEALELAGDRVPGRQVAGAERGVSRSAACSRRSTNACTSGSDCTARPTWRSYSSVAVSSSLASTVTATRLSILRTSASAAFGLGAAAT